MPDLYSSTAHFQRQTYIVTYMSISALDCLMTKEPYGGPAQSNEYVPPIRAHSNQIYGFLKQLKFVSWVPLSVPPDSTKVDCSNVNEGLKTPEPAQSGRKISATRIIKQVKVGKEQHIVEKKNG